MDFRIFMINASVNSICAQDPPGLLQGICQSWGWGICKFCAAWGPGICRPQGYSQAFDTYMVSYQNITTQRILLGKKTDWLKSHVKKGMLLILCTHFFIAYQARIT